MRTIALECKGRLANQIICWANARCVLRQLGVENYLLAVNPKTIAHDDRLIIPGGVIERDPNRPTHNVTRADLTAYSDCLWVWEDLFFNRVSDDELRDEIRTIKLSEPFAEELDRLLGRRVFVGIHVRLGDFTAVDYLNPPLVFPAFVRAPKDYYQYALWKFRSSPIFMASDGVRDELPSVPGAEHVIFGRTDDPVFDLFALSRCRLLFGSCSTFSTVASTYGVVPLILPGMTDAEMEVTNE